MKLTFKNTALAAVMLAGALSFTTASTQTVETVSPGKRATLIKAEIDSLELVLNKMLFTHLIESRENTPYPISIFGFRGYNPEALFDTVPEIRALRSEFLEADRTYEQLLKSDPKYAELYDNFANAKNKQEQEEAIFKLSNYRNLNLDMHPEWNAASNKRMVALSNQNAAITRFLLNLYQSQKKIMPTVGLIPPDDIENIINSNPPIREVSEKIAILRSIQMQVLLNSESSKWGLTE